MSCGSFLRRKRSSMVKCCIEAYLYVSSASFFAPAVAQL
jgi:hypothetical protein